MSSASVIAGKPRSPPEREGFSIRLVSKAGAARFFRSRRRLPKVDELRIGTSRLIFWEVREADEPAAKDENVSAEPAPLHLTRRELEAGNPLAVGRDPHFLRDVLGRPGGYGVRTIKPVPNNCEADNPNLDLNASRWGRRRRAQRCAPVWRSSLCWCWRQYTPTSAQES